MDVFLFLETRNHILLSKVHKHIRLRLQVRQLTRIGINFRVKCTFSFRKILRLHSVRPRWCGRQPLRLIFLIINRNRWRFISTDISRWSWMLYTWHWWRFHLRSIYGRRPSRMWWLVMIAISGSFGIIEQFSIKHGCSNHLVKDWMVALVAALINCGFVWCWHFLFFFIITICIFIGDSLLLFYVIIDQINFYFTYISLRALPSSSGTSKVI